MPETLETRALEIRAKVDDQTREVTGVGVPYGETITIWGQRERLAPGSVEAEGAKLFYRHSEPIGLVRSAEDTETGWHPTAVISQTARGDEAYQLARDGVLDGLSIGFEPLEWHIEREDDGDVIVYDRVQVREVSLVPFPAYPSAQVTAVRHAPTHTEGDPTMGDKNPDLAEREADLKEIREGLETVTRKVDGIAARGLETTTPEIDKRSAGEWLRAIVTGDEASVREYEEMVERAYTGGTSADGLLTPQYVGDTIRLFNSPDPLGSIFSTGVLPSKGLKLEHGVLESDDIDVTEQVKEGDDLAKGSISVGLDYANIKTYGGHVELSRQQIERTTNVSMLDLSLRALGLRGARRKASVLRSHYAALTKANALDPDRVVVLEDDTSYVGWISAVVDAAEKFIDLGLPLEAMVVDKTYFKDLAALIDSNGRPLLRISGTGVNTVGEISPKALNGELAGLKVVPNLKQTSRGAAFVNGEAIRQYASPITELADENIVNLSKRFGLYYYAANATEIPAAVVPIVDKAPEPLDED